MINLTLCPLSGLMPGTWDHSSLYISRDHRYIIMSLKIKKLKKNGS